MAKSLLFYFTCIVGTISFAQTTFSGLGGNDSGGTGFKTITNIPELVVSNNFNHTGTEIYGSVNGSGNTETLTIKADGVDADFFDVNDIQVSNFTGSSQYVGSTIQFKNTAGTTIQTMETPDWLSTTAVSIGTLFTTGNTLPVNNVAEIVITITGGGSPSNFTFEAIDISNATLRAEKTILVDDISVFPNPSDGWVNINTKNSKQFDVEVFNSLGQSVYKQDGITNDVFRFNLNQPTGLYFIKVGLERKQEYYRLLKK